MKILIAIMACWDNLERVNASRRTWIPQLNGTHYKVFLGRSPHSALQCAEADDEIFLDVDDSYTGVVEKLRAIYRWALAEGYDYVFSADDDTYIVPSRLEVPVGWNYVGRQRGLDGQYADDYASGGAGVWLSRTSLEVLVNSGPSKTTFSDKWIGDTLRASGIICRLDRRYILLRDLQKYRKTFASCETFTRGGLSTTMGKIHHEV
jgi:hypothetical protein